MLIPNIRKTFVLWTQESFLVRPMLLHNYVTWLACLAVVVFTL
jgi:hypothetical protein